MSLINEALKKAQKQRTGETPSLSAMPTLGGERPDKIAHRSKSSGVGEFLLPMLGLGFVGLAVLGVGGFFLYRSLSRESAPAAQTTAVSPPVATPPPAPAPTAPQPTPQPALPPREPVVVATAPQPASATSSVSSFTVPNVATPAPTQPEPAQPVTPTVTLPAPAPVVAAITPPSAPAPQPVQSQSTTPAAPPKFEPRAINHIEALRVTGIRVSSDPRDSKVLMNDRVYRLGSLIDAEMGIRLVGITAASLTFEDDRGARYTRLFN
ncbi:hypothetical protein ESB00_08055 [Oleiharenicola lentus]|uniref:Uncharacterized protein n=1 Tax=Oleiharenicola lentus TaxID=2508720 RepID=A0A4Q1C9U6_9BACT|nr:hypothetical protein [Oleiharenicola lentus]RXK55827.1 hypothetical protein ESB00_08055 [Oleiharenicola lentus]